MKNLQTLIKLLAFTATLFLIPVLANAQQVGEPVSGGPVPGSSTAVPVDGGASLLAASGIAYGIKRIRARKKAQSELKARLAGFKK